MARASGGKGTLTKEGYVVPSRAKATRGSAEQVNAANNKLVKENNQLLDDNEKLLDEVNRLTSELETIKNVDVELQRLGNIATALDLLDHAKDDQWTKDGLPGVEAVCALMEDDTVTRAEIAKALPDFIRVVQKAEATGDGQPISQQ